MDSETPLDLIEANHRFPGVYQIKAIGSVEDDFVKRVLDAVHTELADPSGLGHSARMTPGGRHVAVTLDIPVASAEQVRLIYARIHQVSGLLFVL